MKLSQISEKTEKTETSYSDMLFFRPCSPNSCIFTQPLDIFRHSCYDGKNHRTKGKKYMIWGIVTAGAVLLLILTALLHAQRRRNRLEKDMVERARTTDLYRALYPVLRTANRCCVDRVLIRRDEVRIVLFKPMNSVYRFVFEERGFDRVNDPKVLKALALAISADMEHLRDNRCYSFSVRQDVTAQGDKVYWYEYNILPHYKDTLTKAWYHQPEVEDGIIR